MYPLLFQTDSHQYSVSPPSASSEMLGVQTMEQEQGKKKGKEEEGEGLLIAKSTEVEKERGVEREAVLRQMREREKRLICRI